MSMRLEANRKEVAVKYPLEFRVFYWIDLVELFLLMIMFWCAALRVDHFMYTAKSPNSSFGSHLLL